MVVGKENSSDVGKVLIEPAWVIAERKRIGLHPTCEVPSGAVLCYDSAFWSWIESRDGFEECDGWLKGAYLAPSGDSHVLVFKVPGFGGPTAVMSLEELAAYGIHAFVNLGSAGGLQSDMQIGDLVVCARALCDEGTSKHYLQQELHSMACPKITDSFCNSLGSRGVDYRVGTSWTTDAPYRETVEAFQQHRSQGVLTVEMEASALFSVGRYRDVHVGSVFTISDILSDSGWHQEYHGDSKLKGLKTAFEVTLNMFDNLDRSDW